MKIYPAIDIIHGACVRLVQGDYAQQTTFAEDPVEVALQWQEQGGSWIHVVDLDGARSGDMPNFELIASMAARVSVPFEVGGGIRTMEAVEKYLDAGIDRVILGTSALKDPELVNRAVERYGARIAVGIDAKDGMVAVSGWKVVSQTPALEFARQMETCGVQHIIYTDIATDGMLRGPNVAAMKEMVRQVSCGIIASGGVSGMEDLLELQKTGVAGAIVGKALYTGRLNLKEAVEKVQNQL